MYPHFLMAVIFKNRLLDQFLQVRGFKQDKGVKHPDDEEETALTFC